jgi:hypothetical protein
MNQAPTIPFNKGLTNQLLKARKWGLAPFLNQAPAILIFVNIAGKKMGPGTIFINYYPLRVWLIKPLQY